MKAILLCTLLCAFVSHNAGAMFQSPTDAQKLQDAQTENQKLRDELAAAKSRIHELERATGTPTVVAPSTPTHADATAELMGNPIAVLDFCQKKFTEDLTKKNVALPLPKDTKSVRQLYLSKAKDWLEQMNRNKFPIVWRGRITHIGAANGPNQSFEFQCVSADNKRNFGRVANCTILKSNAPQLGSTVPDRDVIWTLNASLEPVLELNPDMTEPNTFDNPPLVGPCVTFRYKLNCLRLFPEKSSASVPNEIK